ncbi:MAG TPA: lipoyl(octanoyl) transferase LipB [Actinomycetes bacterium]|nr:lipoyl(octanoyl) transferase LipB [Actinomycetes bacterium]
MSQLEFDYRGRMPYQAAWDEQRRLHALRVAEQIQDTVLLLEHDPVYTAGRRTEAWERPIDGTQVIDVDRGGKITWHGPGQLVGYPIIKLPDSVLVVDYVRRLEDALIAACAELGLTSATKVSGRSGVWVPAMPATDSAVPPVSAESAGPGAEPVSGPDRKVAAIGVRVANGVTMHGFALNCDCDLSWFDRIVPCGISDASVTSLSAELARPIGISDARPAVQAALGSVFAGATV